MKSSLSLAGKVCLNAVLVGALLAGCSSPTPITMEVTQDPAALVEMVVGTVDARMTQQALENPTATTAPTSTPEPTATLEPTATIAPIEPTAVEEPTATSTTAAALSAEFQYATTFPEHKYEYIPNELFSLAMGFKNTGTVAWEPGYKLVLVDFEGEVTCAPEVEISKSIAPGEKAEFSFWAFGSETLGTHVWYFQLYSPSGGAIPGGYASFTYTSH